MKAYEDQNCECHKIVEKINKKFPKANWNCDQACDMWCDESEKLMDNNIEFEPYSDERYGCTCPTCGNFICGWCV
jgi:hypothetical protein